MSSDLRLDIPDELFDQLKAQFSSKQLVELTSSIARENYRVRFDHAFGIESAELSEGASAPFQSDRCRHALGRPRQTAVLGRMA